MYTILRHYENFGSSKNKEHFGQIDKSEKKYKFYDDYNDDYEVFYEPANYEDGFSKIFRKLSQLFSDNF